MSTEPGAMKALLDHMEGGHGAVRDPGVAHVVIDHHRVLGAHTVPGLAVEVEPEDQGMAVSVRVAPGVRIEKPVHMCFGMLPAEGLQRIRLSADIGDGAAVSVLAHCVFPNARDVEHRMDAVIRVGRDAAYAYTERHVHAPEGGVRSPGRR